MLLRINGVVDAALLTFVALTSRSIIPCFNLVFRLSTFGAFFHGASVIFFIFHILSKNL